MKLKAIIFYLVFCIANKDCFAQSRYTDSISQELKISRKKDTNYIKNLTTYGYLIMYTNTDSSYICARQSIEFSKKMEWAYGSVNGMLLLSQLYYISTKYDSAVFISLAALKISEKLHDDIMSARTHHSLSESYRTMNVLDLAEYHGLKGLDFANATKNDIIILTSLTSLHTIYCDFKKWNEAEKYYGPAMEKAKKLNNKYRVAVLLETHGLIKYENKDYKEALGCFRESISYFKSTVNYPYIAYLQTELCNTFVALKNKDSAAFYGNAALATSKEHGLKKELTDTYDALFNYAYGFGDYKKAIEYKIIFDSLDTELNSQEMSQNMERGRLEFAQKEKDLIAKSDQEKKDNEARRIKNLQFVALGAVLLIAVFLFIYSRQKQKAKSKIEKAYSDLKSTQQQLIQSEKMASLGELTAGIAHEIQNPLNFVNNFSDVNKELISELKAEIKKGNIEEVNAIASDIEANEEKINHHGKRADAIVKNMLQHSRKSTGQKEPTDINALADEYIRLAYHGMRAKDKSFNVTIKTDFDKTIGNINIIPQDIGRVILNLVNNAFYAASQPSEGGLSETGFTKTPTVLVKTRKDDNKVLISVKDNGSGIPANILAKIFQPFFTTKPTGQGTGLGLSLSYDIVKAHGGELKMETKEGEGATFLIELPFSNKH